MQRKWAMLAAGAMVSTMLTGCMEKHGELGNRNIRGNSVSYDMNGNRILNTRFANDQMNEMNRLDGHRLNSNNLVGLHKNYRLEMSEAIADRIASLNGVSRANVMLTDNNAYVAVSLKKGATSMGLSAPTPLSRTHQAYLRPYNVNSLNSYNGMNANGVNSNAMYYHGMNANNGMNANTMNANTMNAYRTYSSSINSSGKKTKHLASSIATPNMHLRSSKGMTARSTTIADGRSSSSFHNVSNGMTNMSNAEKNLNGLSVNSYNGMRNTYWNSSRGYTNMMSSNMSGMTGTSSMTRDVARGTTDFARTVMPYAANRTAANHDVTTAIKDQIANEVKRMSPGIKNVYVSADPEFVDRMNAYMGDVRAGRPIQGFIAEFNAMVDRIFPTQSGK